MGKEQHAAVFSAADTEPQQHQLCIYQGPLHCSFPSVHPSFVHLPTGLTFHQQIIFT